MFTANCQHECLRRKNNWCARCTGSCFHPCERLDGRQCCNAMSITRVPSGAIQLLHPSVLCKLSRLAPFLLAIAQAGHCQHCCLAKCCQMLLVLRSRVLLSSLSQPTQKFDCCRTFKLYAFGQITPVCKTGWFTWHEAIFMVLTF